MVITRFNSAAILVTTRVRDYLPLVSAPATAGRRGPEVAVTVQQVYLPVREGFLFNGPTDGVPALRTMSVSIHDSKMLSDNIRLDYGGSFDSVSYLDRLNSLNNYARLSYNLGPTGKIMIAVSSGAPATDLLIDRKDSASEITSGNSAALARGLAALAVLPRLSMLDGNLALQRTRDVELGYRKSIGATTFDITGYAERVSNAAMTVVSPNGAFAAATSSRTFLADSILNAGSYSRMGVATSVAHQLGDYVQVGASFGNSGALAANDQAADPYCRCTPGASQNFTALLGQRARLGPDPCDRHHH